MDEKQQPQLLTAAIVAVLIGGGFFAYQHFFKGDGGSSSAGQEASAPSGDGEGHAEKSAHSEADRKARLARERKLHIDTDHFDAVLTNLNTALVSFTLKGKRFVDDDHPHQMVTTDKEPYLPLGLELRGVKIPDDAVWDAEQLSPESVRFTWEGHGFRVVREMAAGDDPYQLWSTLTVTNEGDSKRPVRPVLTTHHYVDKSEEDGGGFPFHRASAKRSQGICRYDDETERKSGKDLLDAIGYGPDVHFTGLENSYFAILLAPDSSAGERCVMSASLRGGTKEDPQGTLYEAELIYPRAELGPGASKTWKTLAFVGPKEHGWLSAAGHGLSEAVDFGWFTWIAQWLVALLSWIHGLVANWGLAIILLTVLVKLVLYPLTEKSFQSMAKMRRLKPEMDRVNELYADDREKKGMAVMELYRKNKINPLAGCLPTLLQMPVWFALYRSLSMNVELYHAPFVLWWQDLSAPDPYYVLPLGLGLLMFAQQKLTPTTMDATQAKLMMYFMPVMITVFMLFLPAGLCLYMVTNSTLGIAQQRWIQHRLDKQDQQVVEPEGAGPKQASTESDSGDESPKPKTAKSPSRAKSRGGKRRQRRG